jgi:hypothetical protein
MRTKNFLEHLILGALLLTTGKMVGQTTVTGNVATANTNFLGWDNTSPANDFPLRVRHDRNEPIEFWTDQLRRMWLSPTLVNQNFAWYQNNNLDFSGHLSIGAPAHDPPLTYIHINQSPQGGVSVGYRPWMRLGTLMTQETDAMYVGTKVEADNQANAVINWSDDATRPDPDPLRFIFTSVPDNSNQARSADGLEIARMIPAQSGNEGYLGVGNFFSAGLQPTDRLDILNGNVRIRQLVNNNALTRVVVSDANGRLHWRDAGTLGSGTSGCEWTMATAPLNQNVSTAYGPPDPNCPDRTDAVGIGVDLNGATPLSKLTVLSSDFDRGIDVLAAKHTEVSVGVKAYVTNGNKENRGLEIDAVNNYGTINNNYGAHIVIRGQTERSMGVRSDSYDGQFRGIAGRFTSFDKATNTYGAWGRTYEGEETSYGILGENYSGARNNFGVAGIAYGTEMHDTEYYGVYGEAKSAPDKAQSAFGVYGVAPQMPGGWNSNSWAGYFSGDAKVTNLFWNSDIQFKPAQGLLKGTLRHP